MSVFEKWEPKAWPYKYEVGLLVSRLCGGVPSNQKVAEGYIKSKLVEDRDDLIKEAAAQLVRERYGASEEEIIHELSESRHLSGFKRDTNGLYIEGRQVKSCIKEAACIVWPNDRWGPTRKGTKSFWAERVSVEDDRIYLGVQEASGTQQRFVKSFRGNGILIEEYVDDVKLSFTLKTNYDFDKQSKDTWPVLWVTAERLGLGASRSQGFGQFEVIKWKRSK